MSVLLQGCNTSCNAWPPRASTRSSAILRRNCGIALLQDVRNYCIKRNSAHKYRVGTLIHKIKANSFAELATNLETQLDANTDFSALYDVARSSGALTISNDVIAPTMSESDGNLSINGNVLTVDTEADDTTYTFTLEGQTVTVNKLDADGFTNDVSGAAQLIMSKVNELGINVSMTRSSGAITFSKGGGVDVSTAGNASASIDRIDSAINQLNAQRANLGAISNRLDSTVNNLTSISSNLQAGRGRIEDADFAAETTSLAKSQILQQASTAMLAQANASKQNVLSLLQG